MNTMAVKAGTRAAKQDGTVTTCLPDKPKNIAITSANAGLASTGTITIAQLTFETADRW
jgi:hypothetical protein